MNGTSFGPRLEEDGTAFRLWAPAAQRVDLVTDRTVPMTQGADGWFTCKVPGVGAGARYQFRINEHLTVPDPASHFQPEDIAAASQVIEHSAFRWRANDWRGRPWHETVLLESHVGTFTEAGTYDAMIGRLDHLVETGVTALELMPLADFPGRRNWGYDGVLWYAPDHVYGTPDDLKRLVDEAHLRGLMVFLDVVYNHFGPDGNYLGAYAPQFFCDASTPWGSAIDYRVPQVREFVIENALHWLTNYRFDGLRLDAVHAIVEPGEVSVLNDLSRAVRRLAKQSGRHIHLVLENDDNRASLLSDDTVENPNKYDAQWNDDYHHAWHVALTGESSGYYRDYSPGPKAHLARMMSSGFAYSGQPSAHRNGAPRGEPAESLSPLAFVNFLQNHDQIGNRAFGDRLETLAKPEAIEAALAITLLSPMVPLLFMGEEWGSKSPFPFFCDFQGELADAVRNGRRKEFADSYATFGDDVPDPLDESTFRSAVLQWDVKDGAGKQRFDLVKSLLAVRKRDIAPLLSRARFGRSELSDDIRILSSEWTAGPQKLRLLTNLSDETIRNARPEMAGRPIWGGPPPDQLPAWSVFWMIGED